MLQRSVLRRALVGPSSWPTVPEGWYMFPRSDLPSTEELHMRKTFSFLKHNSQYNFLGQSMSFAKEIECIPVLEWFFTELTVTVPPTPKAEVLASFMNDLERLRCGLRNQSAGTSTSRNLWSPETLRRVETMSEENFCWCLTDDLPKTQSFLQETLMQWQHRADYLVTRKSRDKKEYRENLTLTQVITEGQERKRRMQQRKLKVAQREEDLASGKTSEWDNFVADVLPREIRESLDRESDGMDDFRYARTGLSTGGWTKSLRQPNVR